MRFIDASVFVHAYLKPRRTLTPEEIQIKKDARNIVNRINEGEPCVTSVVHFSEIANLLEEYMPLTEAIEVERALSLRDTVRIERLERRDCLEALSEAEETKIGLSDSMAILLMKKLGISEVYSFDHDFDKVAGIKRLRK